MKQGRLSNEPALNSSSSVTHSAFNHHVDGLWPLLAIKDLVGDPLTFLERGYALRLDLGDVDEEVFFTFVRLDESKTFLIEVTTDCSCRHRFNFLIKTVFLPASPTEIRLLGWQDHLTG